MRLIECGETTSPPPVPLEKKNPNIILNNLLLLLLPDNDGLPRTLPLPPPPSHHLPSPQPAPHSLITITDGLFTNGTDQRVGACVMQQTPKLVLVREAKSAASSRKMFPLTFLMSRTA